MEQTTSTTSTTAAPAPQGALAVTAAAPAGEVATDAATQFGNLLDALQQTAALAPVTESGDEGKDGSSAKDGKAKAGEADASASAATVAASLVPVALLVPVPAPAPAAPASSTPAGEPAGQAAAVPVTGLAATAVLPVAGPVVPTAAAAPATATDATVPAAIALPDGDVDPALVQAAITAAGESAPARVATGAATKGAARSTATAVHATAASAERSAPATADVVDSTTAATSGTAPVAPATEPDAGSGEQGASSGSGSNPAHPARFDLQVQPAPRVKEAAPAASAETSVPPLDRERLDRLADGLAVRLRVSHAAEGARIRMQLEPRELGEVIVRLELRDGVAHAHLIAESKDASRTLSASLGDLRSALADRGLQLESVSVRVAGEGASNSGGQADQSQTDRRSRSPLTFGRLDSVAAQAATDPADRALDGHAVWMLA